jgi:hypothetical protein
MVILGYDSQKPWIFMCFSENYFLKCTCIAVYIHNCNTYLVLLFGSLFFLILITFSSLSSVSAIFRTYIPSVLYRPINQLSVLSLLWIVCTSIFVCLLCVNKMFDDCTGNKREISTLFRLFFTFW